MMHGARSRRGATLDRKSGSAGMPRPRSTLFPYTTLFRSRGEAALAEGEADHLLHARLGQRVDDARRALAERRYLRSEERFSRNAETEIYTLSLHDALPISWGSGPRRR